MVPTSVGHGIAFWACRLGVLSLLLLLIACCHWVSPRAVASQCLPHTHSFWLLSPHSDLNNVSLKLWIAFSQDFLISVPVFQSTLHSAPFLLHLYWVIFNCRRLSLCPSFVHSDPPTFGPKLPFPTIPQLCAYLRPSAESSALHLEHTCFPHLCLSVSFRGRPITLVAAH